MTIETLEISGFASALQALRLPFGKECRSDVYTNFEHWRNNELHVDITGELNIHEKDLALMQTLVKRGPEHAKVVRGILVYAKITAPVYWWAECECYTVGHQRLCSESTMHVDCKGLQGAELQKAKAEIPMGKELTKIDFFSYQCLRNMYFQRKDHRLPEWHDTFCRWVESLPYAKELILIQNA